jgi:hypothetical protein
LVDQRRIPEGWSLRPVDVYTDRIRRLQKEIGPLFIEQAWSPIRRRGGTKERVKEWRQKAFSQCLVYEACGHHMQIRAKSRLLGLSVRNTRRFLNPSLTWEQIRDETRSWRVTAWLPDEAVVREWPHLNEIETSPEVTVTFSKVCVIPFEDSTFYWGPQSVVKLKGGSVLFGPPPTY